MSDKEPQQNIRLPVMRAIAKGIQDAREKHPGSIPDDAELVALRSLRIVPSPTDSGA